MALVLCMAAFVGCGTGTNSESLEELIALGAQYLVDGNYSEAVVAFDKAIKVDDKSVVAYVGLGDGNLGLEDYDKAGEAYEKAIAVDDQTVEAYIGRADAYLFEDNAESAVAILNEGYEATGNAELSSIVEEINAGTYEPSVLHMDWQSMYTAENSDENKDAEEESEIDGHPELANCEMTVKGWFESPNKSGHWIKEKYTFDSKGRMTEWIDYEDDGNTIYSAERWEYDETANVTRHYYEGDEEAKPEDFESEIQGCAGEEDYLSIEWNDAFTLICNPFEEDKYNGYYSKFEYGNDGRVKVIRTYNSSGEVVGSCDVTYREL